MFEAYDYKGSTITIHPDPDPMNPRTENCNLGTMVCSHRSYKLGDVNATPEQMKDELDKFGTRPVVLPLYLYDHSGITMNTTGFSCPWDSGHVGWICVSEDDVLSEYGDDYTVAEIERILTDEVAEYNMYIMGEVYGYEIELFDGAEPESCWGFYEYDFCRSQAEEFVDQELDIKSNLG